MTPRDLGPGSEAARTRGRCCGHSDPGPSSPRQLVDPVVPPTRAGIAQRAGRHRGHSDPGPSGPGQLVNPVEPWTQARDPRDSYSKPGLSDTNPSRPGTMVDTGSLGHKSEMPGTAGRPHRPSDQVPGLPAELIGTTGTQRRCPNLLGELVDTEVSRTHAGVAWDIWKTTRGLGYNSELPGTAGQPRGHSDPKPSRPGELSTPGSLDQARVARDSCSTPPHLGHVP